MGGRRDWNLSAAAERFAEAARQAAAAGKHGRAAALYRAALLILAGGREETELGTPSPQRGAESQAEATLQPPPCLAGIEGVSFGIQSSK
jgi:hypothetical protein